MGGATLGSLQRFNKVKVMFNHRSDVPSPLLGLRPPQIQAN